MKKILCLVLAVLSAIPIYACTPKSDPVSLMIATDLHYISPSLTENAELFRVAVDNADGKVSHYSEEITDAFVENVTKIAPKALIISGDLTFNGAEESHAQLVKKLEKIEEGGVEVLVIPGNHDVDSTNAYSFSEEKVTAAEALTSPEFFELYEDFGPDVAISRDETSFSYVYAASSGLRIIMIDSNTYGKGFIKDSTFEWLENELKQAKNDKADVITVTHQNVYAHSDLLSFGYTLYNAKEFEELLVKYKVNCNLSGHIHTQSAVQGKICEIVTAALPLGSISYGMINCNAGKLTYKKEALDVSAWAKSNGSQNAELLSFKDYSVNYFKENCDRQVSETVGQIRIPDEDLLLMKKTFADINFAYFMGNALDISDDKYSRGLSLWAEYGTSFFTTYINSMTKVISKSRCEFTVKL